MFSTETIAALAVGGVLAILIPVIAVIVFKKRNRDSWLPSVFIGAGTFIVFAVILESILHVIMQPIVKGSVIVSSVYAALAAGVFEETGRFVAYKTLMRKHYTTKNAVLMGIGHGGCEAIVLLGITLLTYLVLAIMTNAMGIDKLVEMSSSANAQAALKAQLESFREYNFISMAMGIYERIVAMTFHVCMSVFVYKAVTQKGKIWLYPAAVLLHALLDFPAALYQMNVITSIPVIYVIMTLFVALVIASTVIMAKKMPDNGEKQR